MKKAHREDTLGQLMKMVEDDPVSLTGYKIEGASCKTPLPLL
jgi:hypothetical protein